MSLFLQREDEKKQMLLVALCLALDRTAPLVLWCLLFHSAMPVIWPVLWHHNVLSVSPSCLSHGRSIPTLIYGFRLILIDVTAKRS